MLTHDRSENIRFRYAVFMVVAFVSVLWIIKAIEFASGESFAKLGIFPRTLKGAIGIFTAPLIHGDIVHLISNTLPILFLGILLFYFYHRIAVELFIWIYLVTGFWTWMLARDAYHIGASGVVYGMASFLFFSGILRKNKQLMTISGIVIFLYGGMVYGVLPEGVESNISWESHLTGALAGVVLAFFFRKTKVDFDTGDANKDLQEEEEESQHFHHTGIDEGVEISYTYKPSKKGP